MQDLQDLSVEQLEQLLAQRKQEERQQAIRRRSMYERSKNELVKKFCDNAMGISELLKQFKAEAFAGLAEFYEQMKEYGDVRGEKGSFQLVSADDQLKVLFSRETKVRFDERAELAESKLKEFLGTTVKKRDQGLHDVIMGLLERNSATNDFDIKLIGKLVKMEENFEDKSWKEAIRLFKESIQESGTADYVRFYRRDENGRWVLINLNLASV